MLPTAPINSTEKLEDTNKLSPLRYSNKTEANLNGNYANPVS